MPTYVYRCWHCEHEIEQVHGMTEEPVVYCPNCNTPAPTPPRGASKIGDVSDAATVQRVMKRVIQLAGLVKKGGGWTPKFHG